MAVTAGRALSARDRFRQKRLRWLGAAILVVGLTAAGIAYHRAQSDDWATALVRAGTLASGNAKRAENQLKELGGKANVLAADFQDWFVSLWHRRRLAGTLVVLAIAGAGACFFLAHLLNFPPSPDGPGTSTQDRGPGNKRPEAQARRHE